MMGEDLYCTEVECLKVGDRLYRNVCTYFGNETRGSR